jgi:hypothetical protein
MFGGWRVEEKHIFKSIFLTTSAGLGGGAAAMGTVCTTAMCTATKIIN